MNISIVLVFIKSLSNLKRQNFFSNLKNECPDDDEIERTKEIIKLFDIKNGDDITKLYF